MRASVLAAVVAAVVARTLGARGDRTVGGVDDDRRHARARDALALRLPLAHRRAARRLGRAARSGTGRRCTRPMQLVISPHGRGPRRARERESLGRPARARAASPSSAPTARAAGSAATRGARRARSPTSRACRRSRGRRSPGCRSTARQIYAFGGSMGGQETLLLLARHPRLLAGVAAFDAVSDFAQQYRAVREAALQRALPARSRGGRSDAACRGWRASELGGSPRQRPLAFARAQPDHVRARDRLVVRAAADLVEPGRPHRRRPAAPVGEVLLEAARAESARADQRLRRLLDPLARDARVDATAVRAAALRALAPERRHRPRGAARGAGAAGTVAGARERCGMEAGARL